MADSKVRLEAVISASAQGMVDALKRASAAVNDSTASWKDRLGRARGDLSTVSDAVRNLGAELDKVGHLDLQADSGAIEKIRESLAGAGGAFSNVQTEVEALKASLVGLRENASALGMPVEEYQRFGEAVKAAGVDAQVAEGMISSMRSRIQDFANGVPEAVELFGRLGITLDQLGSRSPVQNLSAIAEAIQGTVPATEQADVSIRMYGQSLDNVISTAKEYSRVLENKGSSEYASDRDIQQAISMADAVDKLGSKVGNLAGAIDKAAAGASGASQAISMEHLLFNSADEALQKYNERLQESAKDAWDVSTAYNDLNRRIVDLSRATGKNSHGRGSSDSYGLNEQFANAEEYIMNFRKRVGEEFSAIQAIMEKRIRAGGHIDTTELDAAADHVHQVVRAIESFRKSLGRTDIVIGDLQRPLDDLKRLQDEIFKLQERAAGKNFMPDKLVLSSGLDEVIEKLGKIRGTDVKVRPKVDMAEIDELRSKMDAIRSMSGKFGIPARMYGDVAGKMAQVESMLASINREAAAFEAESARVHGFWERMSDSLGSFGRVSAGVLGHPIRSMQELHGWALRTMDAVNGIGKAGENAGSGVSGMARQVAGMMLGVGSMAAGVVKAFRMIGNIINDNLIDPLRDAWKGMVELSERRLGINQGLYSWQADKWKSAKQALQEYYDMWRRMQSEEATSVDAAKEAKARRDLERSYGITVDASSGDMQGQIAGELDKAQANYVKALEGQERELANAQEEAQKALARVTSYWKSGIWYRGNKSKYESDIKGLQDKLNSLSAEYAKVTEALHRARRDTPGADFAAEAAAQASDEEARRYRDAEEKRLKEDEDLRKAQEDAASRLDSWAAETFNSDGRRRLDEIYDKYEDLLLAGVPEHEARPVLEEAVRKEIERQERERADVLKRINEEYERHLEAMADAHRRELDANRRLLEATKGLYDAQEREVYRRRLNDIGRIQERLRRRMGRFGFTLPDGLDPDRPNLSVRERRTIRLDERIADKLARRQAGERVHFTRRERDRMRELDRLQRRDKSLTAEAKAIQAAQTQEAAANTMQSAVSSFDDAVRFFLEAVDSRRKADKEERDAREKRDRELSKAEKPAEPGRSEKWSEKPHPAPEPAEPKPAEPKPAEPVQEPVQEHVPEEQSNPLAEAPAPEPVQESARERVYGFGPTGEPFEVDPMPVPQVPEAPGDDERMTSYRFDRNGRMTGVEDFRPLPDARREREKEERAKEDYIRSGEILEGIRRRLDESRRLEAPSRTDGAETGAGARDYTPLLERIEAAVKNNKGNLTLK